MCWPEAIMFIGIAWAAAFVFWAFMHNICKE